MSEDEKNAYRELLYHAMLDIRALGPSCQPLGIRRFSRLHRWRQYVRSVRAGAIAEWLHNLAYFAAHDFRHFDQALFWDEYDRLCRRFPPANKYEGWYYRSHFEMWKKRAQEDSP